MYFSCSAKSLDLFCILLYILSLFCKSYKWFIWIVLYSIIDIKLHLIRQNHITIKVNPMQTYYGTKYNIIENIWIDLFSFQPQIIFSSLSVTFLTVIDPKIAQFFVRNRFPALYINLNSILDILDFISGFRQQLSNSLRIA
jgi:hypothetical protein